MRVLITADAVGGVWTYALDLARGLAPHGAETLLAVTGPSPTPDQRRTAASIPSLTLIDTGLPLDWLAETAQEVARAGDAVMRLAATHGADLIHLNTPALGAHFSPHPNPSPKGEGLKQGGPRKSPSPSGEGLGEAAQGSDDAQHRWNGGGGWGSRPACDHPSSTLPIIAAAHSCLASWWEAAATGPLPESFRWRTDLHVAGLRAADRTIAPSAAFADATYRLYGVRSAVVHNGRSALPAPPRPQHDAAITVGRLWDKGKNVGVLDAAAAHLSVPLFAAGSTHGPNGDSIRFAHAHPLGALSDTELGERLAARPVFVSSALYEPFGLAVLEAAAAGCALVLSDIPTFRELWDGCATFVDPADARGFARGVEALIGDAAFREARGHAARARAARFTPEATAAATLAIYRSVLPAAGAVAA